MTTPEDLFQKELEIYRTEVKSATQFLYAYLSIHSVAADHDLVRRALNRTALLWNTILGGLQTSTFIAIGRVFDQKSTHNLNRLLKLAERYPEIFSKESLAKRKEQGSSNASEWLDEYMQGVYVPTPADFRRLRAHIAKRRKVYERNYRDIRHKWFAHKEISDQAEVAALFSKGTTRELQQLVAFLNALYESLWQLFINGIKPTLRQERYSVKRMRNFPSPPYSSKGVQEVVTAEAERLLLFVAGIK